ncbi:unnamed protein product [Prorocentrum cordatum]|uniref:Uncharacterized protein n=1 Tax=Prorocentrum cordatum TaxID=2364126 RepID=A0ABN9WC16_9DINO|nr:unnamed protein product [Polarella glacialis]
MGADAPPAARPPRGLRLAAAASAAGPAFSLAPGGPAPAGAVAPAPAPWAAAVDPHVYEAQAPAPGAAAVDPYVYEAVLGATQEEFAAIGGGAAFQAQEWRQELRETARRQRELGDEALARVARQESLATRREAAGMSSRELLAARQMSEAVQDARARAMPAAVDESAREWASNLSWSAAARAMEPAVQAAREEARSASELQRRAAHQAQTAALLTGNLTGLAEAVQGAQAAMDRLVFGFLANYSGAVDAAAQRLARLSDASVGAAELAYRTALEARETARASLDRSRAAEQSALEALARSRANAGRIARLKNRMAAVLADEQVERSLKVPRGHGAVSPEDS